SFQHQNAARLRAPRTITEALAIRSDVRARIIVRSPGDTCESHSEFVVDFGIEAESIAVGGVLRIVVAPCQRPVVAIDSRTADLVIEDCTANNRTGRVWSPNGYC